MKIATLIKKEFYRFFRDPRLIVTMLLPGILIYVIYSLMGNMIFSEKKYDFTVYVEGESRIVALLEEGVAAAEGMTITIMTPENREDALREVKENKATALVSFSENFDEIVENYKPADGTAPQVRVYYNSASEAGMAFYAMTTQILESYERSLANKFDVNAGDEVYDFGGADGVGMNVMSNLLPFLIVIFVFSAAMSLTLESVAGEKERGTLATVLVTSVKRSHVALGKIVPLSCISMIGAASSFLGVILSMPKLMGSSVGSVVSGIGFLGYLFLFLLILSVVPLIVSAICVVSTYAKSVKEASAYTGVIMIFVMVLSLTSLFLGGIGDWIVAVPLLNAVSCMSTILTATYSVWKCLVTVGVNLAFTALIVFAMAKMLSSERIMFGK